MGQKASIILKPFLLLNGEAAPLNVIEEAKVNVQTTT